ncbi:hypothetical protein ACX8XP_06860 [Calditrichota bacterium LG25]
MTRPEFTNQRNLDFSHWIRANLRDSFHGLIVHDIDWIMVNYCTGFFIIVEQKSCQKTSSRRTNPAQTVIFKMLNEFLQTASDLNRRSSFSVNPATQKPYIYQGAFILEFLEGTDPDSARQILVNGRSISKQELIQLLNLESDSEALLQRYRTNWIEENLKKQLGRLKGRCDG